MPEIRAATPEDVPRIREVAREAWQAAYAAFLTPGQCRRALDDPAFDEAPELRNLMGGIADLFLKPIDHVIQARAAS